MEQIQIQEKESLNIGDLFVTSWGYDQTNYDYIIVIGISSTNKTAICQLADYDTIGYTSQAYIQKPALHENEKLHENKSMLHGNRKG